MSDQNQARYLYELVRTEDGSPSVVMGSSSQVPEMMHHSGGALTESLYIYLAAVRRAVELGFPPHVISVGLGIGYNEAITCAYLLSVGRANEMRLFSFEIDPVLREHYVAWLAGADISASPKLPAANINLAAIFSEVLERVSAHFSLKAHDVHTALAEAFRSGRFQLHKALEQRPNLEKQFSCILFDAFSKKATPDLWQENFLAQFLADACAPGCVLATYAATGNLNRALRGAGFSLVPRTGFQGKRESTWAERLPPK
jgi:hypothetical protein